MAGKVAGECFLFPRIGRAVIQRASINLINLWAVKLTLFSGIFIHKIERICLCNFGQIALFVLFHSAIRCSHILRS